MVLAPPLQMRQIKELVSKLDIRSPNETARIHVYHLKNAQATEMVDVLGGLVGGGGGVGNLSPETGRDSLGRGSAIRRRQRRHSAAAHRWRLWRRRLWRQQLWWQQLWRQQLRW